MADIEVEKQTTNETQQEQPQSKEIKHSEVGHKSLLQSDALYQVIFFLIWILILILI